MQMNNITFRKSIFYYFVFFNLLALAKGIGLDSTDITFIFISILSVIFLVIHILYVKFTIKQITYIALFILLGAIITLFSKKTTIFISIIAIIFAKDIPYERLFKSVFIVRSIAFIFMIVLGVSGIIDSSNSFRIGDNGEVIKRYSLGFVHPNITYLNFYIIILLFIYIYYKRINIVHCSWIFLLSLILFKLTDSRTGLLSVLLSLLIVWILKSNLVKKKIVKKLIVLTPLFCNVFSILTAYYYSPNNNVIEGLNNILTGRIGLANRFLNNYKITLFGQKIVEGSNLNGAYLRIDNGYISLLLAYGIIISLIYIVLQTIILRKFISEKRYKEILLILSFAIYGITEVYIYNIFVNISLIFLSEILYIKRGKSS